MSIATEITRLQTAKADIKTAIEAKGVTVPSNAKLDTYDTYVAQISGGGGSNKLPELVSGSVTSITAADLGNITNIKHSAFRNCTSLTSLTLPNTVTIINKYAIADCTGLSSITIPSGVTALPDSLFRGDTGLSSISILGSIISIGSYAFYDCKNPQLTNISFSDLSNLTEIGTNAFENMYHLTSIDLGATSSLTTIPNNCFSACISLTSVTLPASITNILGYAFSNCGNLTEITFLGTKQQWTAISKASSWKTFSSITTIHCSDGDIIL